MQEDRPKLQCSMQYRILCYRDHFPQEAKALTARRRRHLFRVAIVVGWAKHACWFSCGRRAIAREQYTSPRTSRKNCERGLKHLQSCVENCAIEAPKGGRTPKSVMLFINQAGRITTRKEPTRTPWRPHGMATAQFAERGMDSPREDHSTHHVPRVLSMIRDNLLPMEYDYIYSASLYI